MFELVKTFQFEAAHENTRGLHGHSYQAEVHVAGEADPVHAWVLDYGEITYRFKPLFNQLDHYLLNGVEGMDDVSASGVRTWIHGRLQPEIPLLKDVHVNIIGDCAFVPRTREAWPAFRLPARTAFTFEAAHFLPTLAETHKCRRMHGHSFHVEIAAGDSGNVEAIAKAIYDTLDHTCLNTLAGLENATSEMLAGWIWQWMEKHGTSPRAVVVAETCTARCMHFGPSTGNRR
ncbi:MAG: hypothetical protein AMXMBFR84_03760 [Candidatus Hydrogenedentota bacterium]